MQQTSIELEGQLCGAVPDDRGPIGGGPGYSATIAPPDNALGDIDDLLEALAQARSGDVVYIAGTAEIDCTTRVYIEELVLELPGGVTLASDRGIDGSPGALLVSDTFKTRPLLQATGPGVRLTGLRLQGPNPKRHLYHHNRSFKEGRGHSYYYAFPTSAGIITQYAGLQVDNCELSGWSYAAVSLEEGDDHHIHHNSIHHNQYNGLGYGVCHGVAQSLIERNLFDYNRHSIAGNGRSGSGYEACHNIELGTSLSHCFDMHGGRDRKDETDIAGTWMQIHHNTFCCPQAAVVIRGTPEKGADIYNNWFHQRPDERSVVAQGRTQIRTNAYGLEDSVFRAAAVPQER
ncbi:MAG: hypothetical protein GKR89_05085 [Candidatus Latescibacteria bacterium]|nr:hypothetical protein [Candidatus Latescibacterota bacterium]